MEIESAVSSRGSNPCLTCGACCAYYRASFYWGETTLAPGGTVPAELTNKLNDFRCVMRGTEGPHPRCIALLGEIGKEVRCSIYDLRSSVCRDFPFSWDNNIHNERCDKARLAWGLKPLDPPTFPNHTTRTPNDPEPPLKPVPRAA
jgi:Fe-S-cluster containining protein